MKLISTSNKNKESKRKGNIAYIKILDNFKISINNSNFKIDRNKMKNIYNNKQINTLKKYIFIIMIINLFEIILPNRSSYKMISSKYSFIILKISGKGNIKIFDNINLSPNTIYINDDKQENINNFFDFKETPKYVKLVWNKEITSSSSMFYCCNQITEIDLSNFDTSKVTDMTNMFQGCSSLTSLDLSNFVTSKVKKIAHMINGCSSLISLDISNFNTQHITTDSCHIFHESSS